MTDPGTEPAIATPAATFRDSVEAEPAIAAHRRLGFARNRFLFWRTRT